MASCDVSSHQSFLGHYRKERSLWKGRMEADETRDWIGEFVSERVGCIITVTNPLLSFLLDTNLLHFENKKDGPQYGSCHGEKDE
jgi:hypothetical protein